MEFFFEVNHKFEKILGYSSNQLRKYKIQQLCYSPDKQSFNSLLQNIASCSQEGFDKELKFIRKDETLIRGLTNIYGVKDRWGNLLYFIASIKEMGIAHQKLNEHNPQLQALFDNPAIGYVITNVETGEIAYNNTFQKMLGYGNENINFEVAAFTHPDDQPLSTEKMTQLNTGKIDQFVLDKRYLKKNQEMFWARTTVVAVRNNGKLTHRIGMIQDINQEKKALIKQKKLLEELQRANKNLNEFAHVVSHDLKAPLRSISGLTSFLQKRYKDKFDHSGQKDLELIVKNAKRMNELINGILEYSRIIKGTPVDKLINLYDIINDTIATIHLSEHPPLNLTITSGIPQLRADVVRIQQIFQNLITNAIQHIDKPEGYLDIGFTNEPEHWVFTVSDNGKGIEERNFEKIFNIFESLHADYFQSRGIGLSIVKKIIEDYGGSISVTSQVGVGTTFSFTLSKLMVKHQI